MSFESCLRRLLWELFKVSELKIFLNSRPLHREEAIYDYLHLASLFQVPKPLYEAKLEIFLYPKAYMGRSQNFSKSQSRYTGKRLTPRSFKSQSHIFLHIFHIFFIFPHVSSISLIYSFIPSVCFDRNIFCTCAHFGTGGEN